jgi:hypothetical protein
MFHMIFHTCHHLIGSRFLVEVILLTCTASVSHVLFWFSYYIGWLASFHDYGFALRGFDTLWLWNFSLLYKPLIITEIPNSFFHCLIFPCLGLTTFVYPENLCLWSHLSYPSTWSNGWDWPGFSPQDLTVNVHFMPSKVSILCVLWGLLILSFHLVLSYDQDRPQTNITVLVTWYFTRDYSM